MKKLIYIIGILMFLSGPLYPWQGHAASDTAPQDISCEGDVVVQQQICQLSSRLKYALRGKGNEGLDWGSGFGATDPKQVGQDLYLKVYNKTQANTMGEAIKATAAQYGMPPERMSLILGGDITPIMERSPLMRVEDAVKIYNSMIATYNDKKDTQDVQATISAKVEPSEMFANGDLSDSGFDLINDLNNIEIILFQKNDLVTFGGTFSPSETPESTTPTPETPTPQTPIANTPVNTNGAPPSASGGATQPATQTAAGLPSTVKAKEPFANPFAATAEDKSKIFAGGMNPNQCFAGQNLDQALGNFARDSATNPKLQSTYVPPVAATALTSGTNTGGENAAGGNQSNAAAGGSGLGAGPAVPVPTGAETPPVATVPPAPAGDYTSPPLCDQIVCLSLDFVMKKATAAFNKTDNCIQCHVQFINEALEKTISHSLIPAKATGNLGESGLCKNAAGIGLGSVGMNISVNIIPMVTPVKDDLLKLGNITDEWDKYAQLNGAWNYDEKNRRILGAAKSGQPVDESPIPSDAERMLEVAITNAPDTATQAQIMNSASQAIAAQQNNEAQNMLVAEISKSAYEEVDTLKALTDEMDAMNTYFQGFQNQMRTLLEDVPGLISSKACVKIKSKQECT